MQEINRFLNQNQDPKMVEKVIGKLSKLIRENEIIEYIAVQKKPVINIRKECLVLTNKRLIFCSPKKLNGLVRFHHFQWKDIANCDLIEGILGSRFIICTNHASTRAIEFLPKSQARLVYRFSQDRLLEILEHSEMAELEKNDSPIEKVTPILNEDPMETLNKLINQLEGELISTEEFEIKKAALLNRL